MQHKTEYIDKFSFEETWVIVPLPLYVFKLRSVQHHGIQLYGVDDSFDVFLAYADLTEGLMDAHGSP